MNRALGAILLAVLVGVGLYFLVTYVLGTVIAIAIALIPVAVVGLALWLWLGPKAKAKASSVATAKSGRKQETRANRELDAIEKRVASQKPSETTETRVQNRR